MVGLVVAALTGSRRLEGLETAAVISVPLLDRAVLKDDDWDDRDDPFLARTGLVVFPDRVTGGLGPGAQPHSSVWTYAATSTPFSICPARSTWTIPLAVMMGDLVGAAVARQSRTIVVAGLDPTVSDTVRSMGALERVPTENFVADVEEAKELIRPLLLADRQGS